MEQLTFEQLPKAVTQLCNKIENLERLLTQKNLPQPEVEKFLTIEQAATLLSLSKLTLYGKVSRREIPVSKKGKRLYFLRSQLEDYIKSGHKKTSEELKNEASDLMKGRS